MSQVIGHISQIIGPVVDVHFESGNDKKQLNLPSIHDALKIRRPNGKILIVEVQQHIGEDTVRTVAMDSTDGLQRGMEVMSTGKPTSTGRKTDHHRKKYIRRGKKFHPERIRTSSE